MSARDELQQWVEGTPNTVGVQVDGKIYYSMDVDLARRVLAEMDAALATLAEVRAEHQPDGDYGYQTECVACGTQWPCTTSAILDRSTP